MDDWAAGSTGGGSETLTARKRTYNQSLATWQQPKTWRFIEQIERAGIKEDIEQAILEVAALYGFSTLFAGFVPDLNALLRIQDIHSNILFQHFPAEWAERYNASNYVSRDPIVHRLQDDRSHFTWHDAYSSCRSSEDARLIQGEASDFGLRAGYVVPIITLDRVPLAFSFGGQEPEIDPDRLGMLAFITNCAAGRLLQILSPSSRENRSAVTTRESDCLLWTSEGKTDWEISVILGISRSTVTKHILSARQKLGAVSKAHAIAIALRNSILR